MVNIWDFYMGDKVEILDHSSRKYVGIIINQMGSGEVEEGADYIAILTEDGQYGFYASDIQQIVPANAYEMA